MSSAGKPRIVFFGLPGGGKTSLAAAFRDKGVVPVDTDGAANAAMVRNADRLEQDQDDTPVSAADALVVAIDASATDAETDRTFGEVRRFLDAFETGRTHGRAVAGLPVFLTLTKCDALSGPAAVTARAKRLKERFDEFLADTAEGFGTLDVSVATTGGLPKDAAVRSDVADLVRDATAAAKDFHSRSASSARRLTATTSAAGTALVALVIGIGVFFGTDSYGPDDPLVARVRSFQAREGPPAVRLGDARLARNQKELQGIRESSGFERLPAELKEYVFARLGEFDAYSAYRSQFKPPRLGPGDVRTGVELDRLDAELATVLQPPSEYASAWAETDAAKLRAKWLADTSAVRAAEGRLHDWYRGLVRRANGLVLADPFDPAWRADGDALLKDAATPPAKSAEPLPGSSGEPLTYAVPLDFARIDFDRRDWESARDRLNHLREAVGAVGSDGVLVIPEPSDIASSLALGTSRLKSLPPENRLAEWTADRFPDPAREELRKRYLRARETGIRHVRSAVRAKLPASGADTPADWGPVAAFATEPSFRDWEALLARLSALAGEAGPTNTVATFLKRESYPVSIRDLEIAIPADLSTQRLAPGPTLTLTRKLATGDAVDYRLKRTAEPTRHDGEIVARYIPDGWDGKMTLAPGDSLSASLPVSADGDVRLVWDSSRTKTFAFESLSRPAALVPVAGPRTSATGVRLTVAPSEGIPAVPAVVPDLSPGEK